MARQGRGHRACDAKEERMAFRTMRVSTVDPQPVPVNDYLLLCKYKDPMARNIAVRVLPPFPTMLCSLQTEPH